MFQLSFPSFARTFARQIIKVQKSEGQDNIRIISQTQPVDEETTRLKDTLEGMIILDNRNPSNDFHLTSEQKRKALSPINITAER